MSKIRVLFVCMGNICRSPTAEGVFNKVLKDSGATDRFMVDSAGTHAYHVGEQPDSRAQQTANIHGVNLSTIRARKIDPSDFEHFDYILAMDNANYQILLSSSPSEHHHKIKLFLEYALNCDETDVPDPYYDGQNGFNHVFNLVADAAQGFYDSVVK